MSWTRPPATRARPRRSRSSYARYEEKPALIGIFLHGPGANQPADLVVVWVASKECAVLTYASHRITPEPPRFAGFRRPARLATMPARSIAE